MLIQIAIGQLALTEFRLRQKLQTLKKFVTELEHITAEQIFLLQSATPIDEYEQNILEQLLQATLIEGTTLFKSTASTQQCIVLPRIGTISPWATKALDIFKNSNVISINQVEHGIYYQFFAQGGQPLSEAAMQTLMQQLYDPLTESVVQDLNEIVATFSETEPAAGLEVDILGCGIDALHAANQTYGLALNSEDIVYLYENFTHLKRNPTDAELMMYGQVNSEHCRHKIFNASWVIDGQPQTYSLFEMIRHTQERHPGIVKVAYNDNAAIVAGQQAARWLLHPATHAYHYVVEEADFCIKVETHNHPTAISPWAGAATGAGGEIRDEAATGCGGYPKAGMTGFAVSHLHIPGFQHHWEQQSTPPHSIATPLEIMLTAPIGASSYNNEFGRPNIAGFFRSFEYTDSSASEHYGYHKPIMIAGGLGQVRPMHTHKEAVLENDAIIVLGGAGMSIGLGGGAASSLSSGTQSIELDFASVQRANPEMQRRAQDVINQCIALGDRNPIHAIHDVGAGGLANAVPELAHQDGGGAEVELRIIPSAEAQMSPLAIWCNESQERYVLAVRESNLAIFEQIAMRERCPYAVIARATAEPRLLVNDAHFNNAAIDVAMDLLFSNTPRLQQVAESYAAVAQDIKLNGIALGDAIDRILQHPTVADKKFLITIGDRSVGGLVARDQMVGPWQVPVADVAVTANSFNGYAGEAMAMGERSPLAVLNPAASVRMAIAEALTNLAAADITALQEVVLSANWMASVAKSAERAALYQGVAAASQFCQEVGISIPVGKDSLSMRTHWQDETGQQHTVAAPLSLVVSAFAPVMDIRNTFTPLLQRQNLESVLLLIDLAQGKTRLGGSIFATVHQQLGALAPDVDDPKLLRHFFAALAELRQQQLILAYHDRSDGGLLATLAEMAFASHCGMDVQLEHVIPPSEILPFLFNEELGVVIQVATEQVDNIVAIFARFGLHDCVQSIATLRTDDEFRILHGSEQIYQQKRTILQRSWSKTSFMLQSLRDNPHGAQAEYDQILDADDPGLHVHLSFNPDETSISPFEEGGRHAVSGGFSEEEIFPDGDFLKANGHIISAPKVAILREQGVNGHYEMAAAFHQAGFAVFDVHMSDLLNRTVDLADFVGLAACGGFSYGDVLGAGRGWAQTILNHPGLRQQFLQFFNRSNTFTLGVCNGCQMLAQLKELIPGAAAWPTFIRNRSEQFEARLSMLEILPSPAIFFRDMVGSRMPIVVSHGEGYAQFAHADLQAQIQQVQQIAACYVDHYGRVTEQYPCNPNGSPQGISALTSSDGRVLIMMPHPERVFRKCQFSWYPDNATKQSPWLRLFMNARAWVG